MRCALCAALGVCESLQFTVQIGHAEGRAGHPDIGHRWSVGVTLKRKRPKNSLQMASELDLPVWPFGSQSDDMTRAKSGRPDGGYLSFQIPALKVVAEVKGARRLADRLALRAKRRRKRDRDAVRASRAVRRFIDEEEVESSALSSTDDEVPSSPSVPPPRVSPGQPNTMICA